ncbi:MAG TPA: hypothetical protein VNG31_10230, partial [Candidatus Baltobacteraceae bacterium]|nr:hypothetical protein [Candidatus Baltobacteraceae bacterium]
YAALYVQWARRLHARYPALSLGGPVFQGSRSDVQTWRNAAGDASWLHRFIAYLAAHRALDLWNFMSFEHYPFGACDPSPYDDLQYEPALATGIVDVWHRDGVPPNMPLLVTEMNFSANATSVFQDVPGALWFADAVGSFLSAGASAAYLYQYAPEPMQRTATRCNTWGSYGMFTGTRRYAVRQKTAQYFAASLLSSQWAQPVDAPQSILPTFEFSFGKTIRFVSSYAIARPDGRYAVLLIDKDPIRQVPIELTFRDGPRVYRFAGPVTIATFGRAQYVWHGDGPNGYANPDGPVAVRRVIASRRFVLEPGSITVVRGRILR